MLTTAGCCLIPLSLRLFVHRVLHRAIAVALADFWPTKITFTEK